MTTSEAISDRFMTRNAYSDSTNGAARLSSTRAGVTARFHADLVMEALVEPVRPPWTS